MELQAHTLLSKNRFRVYPRGRVQFSGIDVGYVEIVRFLGDDVYLMKRSGHMTWSGVGAQSYAPVRYYIVEFDLIPKEQVSFAFTHKSGVVYELENVTKKRLAEFIQTYEELNSK